MPSNPRNHLEHVAPKLNLQHIPRDTIFKKSGYPLPFEFNKEVAAVFDDMALRSIPIYRQSIELIGDYCQLAIKSPAKIVDLGCSTGTLIDYLSKRLEIGCDFLGIDSSDAMISQARDKRQDGSTRHKVSFKLGDVMTADFGPCDFVIANFMMQFLPKNQRSVFLKRIQQALPRGGMLFLSEKIISSLPSVERIWQQVYQKFKLANRYTFTEIEKKKQALENVLIPQTEAEHQQQALDAGFSYMESILKINNFVTYVAIK